MGIASIAEKKTLKDQHASAYSASFSVVIAALALLLIPFADFAMSAASLAIIFVVSLISTASYIITARVYKHGSLAISSSILSSLPIFLVVALAFPLLGEHLTIIEYGAILVMVVASYLILFKEDNGRKPEFEKSTYKYQLFGVCVLNAASTLIVKYLMYSVQPLAFLILLTIFMAIEMLAYMQVAYGGLNEVIANTRKYGFYILLISVFTLGTRLTNYLAFALAEASLVAPLRNTIFVVMVVISGALFFDEDIRKEHVLLIALLLVASYFIGT